VSAVELVGGKCAVTYASFYKAFELALTDLMGDTIVSESTACTWIHVKNHAWSPEQCFRKRTSLS